MVSNFWSTLLISWLQVFKVISSSPDAAEQMTSKHRQCCQQVTELLLGINNVKMQMQTLILGVKLLCKSSWAQRSSTKASIFGPVVPSNFWLEETTHKGSFTKYFVSRWDFSASAVGRWFPWLGSEAASRNAHPKTAVAADSVYLLLLFPRAFRFFFCIIRSWAETTPYCLDSGWWAGATSTGSASLGSRAVGFCVSRGAAKRGIGLGVTSSSWCKCGSELVWGGGTSGDRVWKLGWDPSLGTCRGAVRRWMRAWDF